MFNPCMLTDWHRAFKKAQTVKISVNRIIAEYLAITVLNNIDVLTEDLQTALVNKRLEKIQKINRWLPFFKLSTDRTKIAERLSHNVQIKYQVQYAYHLPRGSACRILDILAVTAPSRAKILVSQQDWSRVCKFFDGINQSLINRMEKGKQNV